MTACTSCGAAMRENARFCGSCGKAASRGCASCGAPMREGAGFCGACGTEAPVYGGDVLFVLGAKSPAVPGTCTLRANARDAIAHTQARLREDRTIRAVCLVGDAETLPFGSFDDPFGYDRALLSDAPYGRREAPTSEADLLTDVPVTRLPTSDPELVNRLLQPRKSRATWRGGLAVSAAVWSEATTEVVRALGADVPLHLSPPTERDAIEAEMQRFPSRLLFNVHGTDQDAVWLGEGGGRYPEVLRPAGIAVADGALVVSEACYGATLADGASSMAPSFLARGAACFVGSTVIAWGSGPGGPPMFADELAREVHRGFDAGLGAGEALHAAKARLLSEAIDLHGGVPAPLRNTLLSFVAYGAPMLKTPADTSKTLGFSPLADARESLRRRLAPDAWEVVSSGRVLFDRLRADLREGDTVAKRLEAMLGTRPAEAHVLRFRGRAGEHAHVVAEARSRGLRRFAGVELGPDGRPVRTFASR